MSKKSPHLDALSYLKNHYLLKEVRKKAKALCSEKNDKIHYPLGKCLDIVAQEYHYDNWYSLYQFHKKQYEAKNRDVPLYESAKALGLVYHDSKESKIEISDADIQKHLKNIEFKWENAKPDGNKSKLESFFTGPESAEEKNFVQMMQSWWQNIVSLNITKINFYCEENGAHRLSYQKNEISPEYHDVKPWIKVLPEILNALSLKYFDCNIHKIQSINPINPIIIPVGPYIVKLTLSLGVTPGHYVLSLDDLTGCEHYNEYFLNIVENAVQNKFFDIHLELRQVTHIYLRSYGKMSEFKATPKEKQMASEMIRYICARYFARDLTKTYYGCSTTIKHNGRRIKLTIMAMPVYPSGYDAIIRVLPYDTNAELQTKSKDIEKAGIGYEPNHAVGLSQGDIMITCNANTTQLSAENLASFINEKLHAEIYVEEEPPQNSGRKDNVNNLNNLIIASLSKKENIEFLQNLLLKSSSLNTTYIGAIKSENMLQSLENLKQWGLMEPIFKSSRNLVLSHQSTMLIICSHCSTSIHLAMKGHVGLKAKTPAQKMYQKLVRLLGPDIVDNQKIMMRNIDGYIENGTTAATQRPCKYCKNSGIDARTFCSEIMVLDKVMQSQIQKGNVVQVMDAWTKSNDRNILSNNMQGKTVLHHALQKMLQGLLDPSDIEKHLKVDFDEIKLF